MSENLDLGAYQRKDRDAIARDRERLLELAARRREVRDEVVQRDELAVVGFGNVHAEPTMQADQEIEPIHRIEIDLVAQRALRIEPVGFSAQYWMVPTPGIVPVVNVQRS